MRLNLYQVDAFTDRRPFTGNPAAVVPLRRMAARGNNAGHCPGEQPVRDGVCSGA